MNPVHIAILFAFLCIVILVIHDIFEEFKNERIVYDPEKHDVWLGPLVFIVGIILILKL